MGFSTISANNKEQITPTMPVSTVIVTLPSIESIREERLYILIPLASLLAVIILSLLVYLMASNRIRCVNKFCRKRQGRDVYKEYNLFIEQYADDEENDEFGNEDNPTKSLLRGRLQINNHFENYLSTSQLNRSSEPPA